MILSHLPAIDHGDLEESPMYYTVRYQCVTPSPTISSKRGFDVLCRIIPNQGAEKLLRSKQSDSCKTKSFRGIRPRATGVR